MVLGVFLSTTRTSSFRIAATVNVTERTMQMLRQLVNVSPSVMFKQIFNGYEGYTRTDGLNDRFYNMPKNVFIRQYFDALCP